MEPDGDQFAVIGGVTEQYAVIITINIYAQKEPTSVSLQADGKIIQVHYMVTMVTKYISGWPEHGIFWGRGWSQNNTETQRQGVWGAQPPNGVHGQSPCFGLGGEAPGKFKIFDAF